MRVGADYLEFAEDAAFVYTCQVTARARLLKKKKAVTLVQLEMPDLDPVEIRNDCKSEKFKKPSINQVPKRSKSQISSDPRHVQILFDDMASLLGGAA
jgi:hypothetical protein